MNGKFDDYLDEDKKCKAEILRTSMNVTHYISEHDISDRAEEARKADAIRKKEEEKIRQGIAKFDDIFAGNPAEQSRARELRERAKAELYFDKLTDGQKERIRHETLMLKDFTANELRHEHFSKRSLNSIIEEPIVRKLIYDVHINGEDLLEFIESAPKII